MRKISSLRIKLDAKSYKDPEEMASRYLSLYFGSREITYPLNPFCMLREEGILIILAKFSNLEGVYIPSDDESDVPVVSINVERPITRQRFTAAHELCHHFRDADQRISCPIDKKDSIERFADKFAAAILMPLPELESQVNKRKNSRGYVSLDGVLEIADYFGVSFSSCLFRIAYKLHAISGSTKPQKLYRRLRKYQPDKKRKEHYFSHANLYAGLVDNLQEQLKFIPSEYALSLFQNEYIYNDSRMEGVEITANRESASAAVHDLLENKQNSRYCTEDEKNEGFMSVAGHYVMYQDIFSIPVKESIDVFIDLFNLNKTLFSFYPNPDYGGCTRRTDTLVIGAKFETVDCSKIMSELYKLNQIIKEKHKRRNEMNPSEYIKHVVRVHHCLTRIHPFANGNGRTTRAFMNLQLVRAGLQPVYIKVEDKQAYIKALSIADIEGRYDELYEIIYRILLKLSVEFISL